MSAPMRTRPDDVVLVSREHLAVLLSWSARQPCSAVPLNAQAQLESELMAPEPPEDWFDEDADEKPVTRRRAIAITVLCCSAIVLLGVGVAWLLLGVAAP